MPAIRKERRIYDATNNEVITIVVRDACFHAIKTMVESDDRYNEACEIVNEIAQIQSRKGTKPDFDLVIPDDS